MPIDQIPSSEIMVYIQTLINNELRNTRVEDLFKGLLLHFESKAIATIDVQKLQTEIEIAADAQPVSDNDIIVE